MPPTPLSNMCCKHRAGVHVFLINSECQKGPHVLINWTFLNLKSVSVTVESRVYEIEHVSVVWLMEGKSESACV